MVCDGLVTGVATRHHERGPDGRQNQMVERRVWQDHPELTASWRDLLGDAGARAPGKKNDRAGRRSQEPRLGVRDVAERPSFEDIGHHDCQGLRLPPLPPPQRRDRLPIPRVARQVIAPHALDCDDSAGSQNRRRCARSHRALTRRLRRVRADRPSGHTPRTRCSQHETDGYPGPRTRADSAGTP